MQNQSKTTDICRLLLFPLGGRKATECRPGEMPRLQALFVYVIVVAGQTPHYQKPSGYRMKIYLQSTSGRKIAPMRDYYSKAICTCQGVMYENI